VRLRFRQWAEARRFAETEGNGTKSLNRSCIALFTLALAACSGKPYVVEPEEREESVRTHRLFVASHGWHTGIIVPARELNDVVPELESRFGAVPYYEVGWGDKKFYQAREATTGLALQAYSGRKAPSCMSLRYRATRKTIFLEARCWRLAFRTPGGYPSNLSCPAVLPGMLPARRLRFRRASTGTASSILEKVAIISSTPATNGLRRHSGAPAWTSLPLSN
jgi:hypothetical protein